MKQYFLENIENFTILIVIVLLTFLLAVLVSRLFKRMIKRSTEELKNDPTNYHFLRHAVTAIIYIVGLSIAIYTVPGLRIVAKSLLAGAGVLAVAIGFASQQALSNIISGVFIVIFKPFRINDLLRIGALNGVVEDITLRHTVIRDFNNKRIIIPNTTISTDVLVNADLGDSRICRHVEIGISYDSNVPKAKEIMRTAIMNHPNNIDHRSEDDIESGADRVVVRVIDLGDSAVLLRGWAWAEDSAKGFEMACDLYETIKAEFDESGIEIPFPHRTLVYKNTIPDPIDSK